MTQPTRVWNRVRVICNIIKRRKMMRVWRRGRNMGKRGGRILETRSKRDRRMRNNKNRKCGRRIYTRKTRLQTKKQTGKKRSGGGTVQERNVI